MKSNKLRHTLSVSYWDGQEIKETFAVGKTKKETLTNWFFQRYGGEIPDGACLPSKRDLISLKWSLVK